ncbi:MAG: DUF21 domain-containing protein [Eubacteriales bacterium]
MSDPYPLSNLITPVLLDASASTANGNGNTLILQILFQILLIFLNAVFACAEIAVISMNQTKLDQLVAKGDKRAKKLSKLTEQPAKFLSTIQVAITLAGFLGSAFAADNFAGYIVNWLYKEGGPVSKEVINSVSVILVTLILSYFTLIFGELVPKRIAMKKTEQLALGMSGMLRFVSIIFAPIVWLLTVSTNGVLKLLGIRSNAEEDEVTEEEIRMMVDAGSEKGAIDVEEKSSFRTCSSLTTSQRTKSQPTARKSPCSGWTKPQRNGKRPFTIAVTRISRYARKALTTLSVCSTQRIISA